MTIHLCLNNTSCLELEEGNDQLLSSIQNQSRHGRQISPQVCVHYCRKTLKNEPLLQALRIVESCCRANDKSVWGQLENSCTKM